MDDGEGVLMDHQEITMEELEVNGKNDKKFAESNNKWRITDGDATLEFVPVKRTHHTHSIFLTHPRADLFFNDGIRTIDFVLAWKVPTEEESKTPEQKERIAENEARRECFESNLIEEGLILEHDQVQGVDLKFLKLYCPFEVCTRYAEILKLRMPMKECDPEARKHFYERVGDVFNELVSEMFPGLPALEFSTPTVLVDMTDCFSRVFNFVRTDHKIFPPRNRQFTAVYSRDKEYLFDVTEEFFTESIRSRIIDFILRRKRYREENEGDEYCFGIEKLLTEQTYDAAYPIHEGTLKEGQNARSVLFKHWASVRNFYKYQPLDHIKDYFGVKIGLYFAWLGFYTYMLIPPAIVGFFCFIYAISTINDHIPSNEICNIDKEDSVTMCPLCDYHCDFWDLEETCFHSKFTYLVDNPSTVFFAVFMSFWAALFLETWKRYSAEITHRWDLTGFDIAEEHPRPQYLARLAHVKKRKVNIVTKTMEPKPPFWKMRFPGVLFSLSSVLLLVSMALVAVLAVIFYRMALLIALYINGDKFLNSYARIFTSGTAAMINLVCIMIFNQVYARVAESLTEMELQRTQTEFDDSLTLKIYLLQFVNYYASIFYIAFIKGKLVGYPKDYNRILGARQEECAPGGCLLELSLQLAIIMVGKQVMNTVMEMIIPQIWKWYNMLTVPENQRETHKRWPQWAKDFRLVNFDPRGLFPEYLEMVLQYGFVTIFVSAFPLAPLFAFINNVFEMRLDGKKLLTHYRRPVSQRVKDIGIWFKILDFIGKFAVITNAFIIAFTSNFIPELVYRNVVSEDGSLEGYLDYSMSKFDVNDFDPQYRKSDALNITVQYCRYPDYRNPPGKDEYDFAPIFWHILAARLAFVVVFENVVVMMIIFIKWMIPDMPYILQEQIRREAYVTNELIVEQELRKARGEAFNEISTGSTERRKISRQKSMPNPHSISNEVRFRGETYSETKDPPDDDAAANV